MIKIENVEVVGWEHAIRGMRNPMNSWEKSDSGLGCVERNTWGASNEFGPLLCKDCGATYESHCRCRSANTPQKQLVIGPNDHELMMKLANGGPVHAKYRRMITVYVDITAPLYWWKEFDTYKVGTVANSCSTMHKIHEKEFTMDDFSCEHLIDENDSELKIGDVVSHITLECVVTALNFYRNKFLEAQKKPMKDESKRAEVVKKYWWQMIQLLPSSYNQKRTVMLNYEVLVGIYKWRKEHKLDEWREFCKWIEQLPYSEIITGMDLNVLNKDFVVPKEENENDK